MWEMRAMKEVGEEEEGDEEAEEDEEEVDAKGKNSGNEDRWT